MMAWGSKGIMVEGIPGLLVMHFESRLAVVLFDLPAGRLQETGERIRKQVYQIYKEDPKAKSLLDRYFSENPVAVFGTLTDRPIMGALNDAETSYQSSLSETWRLRNTDLLDKWHDVHFLLNHVKHFHVKGTGREFDYSAADRFKELLQARYSDASAPVKKPAAIKTLVEESETPITPKTCSYVISVSLGKGCYRHIQIAANWILADLSDLIIDAFAFDDDHLHAFFMDNQAWSHRDDYYSMPDDPEERCTEDYPLSKLKLMKGKEFLYLFDYGDFWEFSCKVLRELTEDTPEAMLLRSVGEPPEQYPAWEGNEDWRGFNATLTLSACCEKQ